MKSIKSIASIFLLTFLLTTTGVYAQKIKSTPFGKGVNFFAEDSSFSLKINFRMQSLFEGAYNFDSEELSSSMMIRRSRLKFGGIAFSDKLEYKVELGLTSSDISTNREDGRTGGSSRIILDAVLKYQFQKHWQVWFGQTKLPGNRERVVSSADLQFVDRSLVNSRFNIDRDAGLWLYGEYGKGFIIRPRFALTNGEGRDISSDNAGGLNYTARLELLPLGSFSKKGDYFLSDLSREKKPKIAFGVTYNFNHLAVRQQGQLGNFVYLLDTAGNETGELAENSLEAIQADMIFKYKGFSILSEYAVTHALTQYSKKDVSSRFNTGSGFNVQAGYLFKSNIELAGRFTNVLPDDTKYSNLKEETEYTLCFSKYFVGHKLKLQSDIGMLQVKGVDKPIGTFRLQTEMQF